MGIYIQCDKCGNFSIEVIGDKAFGCDICSELEYLRQEASLEER